MIEKGTAVVAIAAIDNVIDRSSRKGDREKTRCDQNVAGQRTHARRERRNVNSRSMAEKAGMWSPLVTRYLP